MELKKIAFPAIIEKDDTCEDYYFVKCPDIEDCEVFENGFYDAILSAQEMLNIYLSKPENKNINPSTKEELRKKFPNKKICFITPSSIFKNELSTSCSHYQILKIVKSGELHIDTYGEAVSPFNKIILFLTVLKQVDILEGHKVFMYEPNLNTQPCQNLKSCEFCKTSLRIRTPLKEELRKLLYGLKEPLIEEYSNIYNLNKEEETEFIDEIINSQEQFACCSMFDLTHNECDDCLCGFHSYESIKNELDKFNCFDNINAFVKKFLSSEYKFIALSIENGKSYNDYILEHDISKRLEDEFKE